MSRSAATTRAFSLIEMTLVVVIMGIIVAIAAPRFADAGSGRRLSAAMGVIERDIETIQLRARATGKVHTIAFYPADDMYVAFEGTEIVRNAIVFSRILSSEPLGVDLSRTNIGSEQRIVVSQTGDLEKSFTIGIFDDGIEKTISFTGVGFTPPSVIETDPVVEIKTGIIDVSIGSGGLGVDLGL